MTPTLTDRQWATIRAAMIFWSHVAENSKTHPMYHPAVQHCFTTFPPLTPDELRRIAGGETVHDEAELMSLPAIAKALGRSPAWLDPRIKRWGIEPASGGRGRGKRLFRLGDIAAALEKHGE